MVRKRGGKKLKRTIILVLLILLAGIFVGIGVFFKTKTQLSKDAIAIFYGEKRKTYVYKIQDENLKYKYINTSIDKKEKVLEEGKVVFFDQVFVAAKDNKAYSYVVDQREKKKYSIEEYSKKVLTN